MSRARGTGFSGNKRFKLTDKETVAVQHALILLPLITYGTNLGTAPQLTLPPNERSYRRADSTKQHHHMIVDYASYGKAVN